MKTIPLKIKKTKENLTPRLGLLFYGRLANRFGLSRLVEKNFSSSGSNRGYKASSYIDTLLLSLYGGGESLSDTREIRNDFALQEMLGMSIVPSDSAIGDWLVRHGNNGGIDAIEKISVAYYF